VTKQPSKKYLILSEKKTKEIFIFGKFMVGNFIFGKTKVGNLIAFSLIMEIKLRRKNTGTMAIFWVMSPMRMNRFTK